MQIVMVNVLGNKEITPKTRTKKGENKHDQINIAVHRIPLTEDAPGDGPIQIA